MGENGGTANDGLGYGLEISSDGAQVLAGALETQTGYIFTRQPDGSYERLLLPAPITAASLNSYPLRVAAAMNDGVVALVSNETTNAPASGAVYIMGDDGAGNWSQQARLTAESWWPMTSQFGGGIHVSIGCAVVGARSP